MFGEDDRETGTLDDATGTSAAEAAELDGSAAVDDDGSAEESDADVKARLEKLEHANRQLLSEKQSREEAVAKALEQERARQPRATGFDPALAQAQRQYEADLLIEQQIMAGVRPANDDERNMVLAAQTRLSAHRSRMAEQTANDARRDAQLLAIDDEDERKEIDELAKSENISVALAKRIVRSERQAKGSDKTRQQERDRLDGLRAAKDAAPQLTSRGVSAREAGERRMKESEINAKLGSFNSQDPEDFARKKAFMRQVKDGTIKRMKG
jgi:predicted phage tail protein